MRYEIFVTPNARQDRIVKVTEKKLEAWVKAPPVGGKANTALLKLLRRYFNTSRIEILKGHKSREKIIQVDLEESR